MTQKSGSKWVVPVMAVVGLLAVGVTAAGGASNGKVPAAKAERIERGRYLVTIGGCNDCHTPFKLGPKGPEPDMARMLSGHPQELKMPAAPELKGPWVWAGAGTNTAFAGPWGVSYAPNLTPHGETGLAGLLTEEQFIQTIRSGKHYGTSRPILPPMPWQNVAQLTDEDLRSVWAFLGSIPAVDNYPPASVPAGG
jgi:hypothetical protein